MNRVIKASHLSFRYSEKKVLSDLNINVPENSVYAFLGLNGAGKTTFIKLVLGLVNFSEGDIKVFNKGIKSNKLEILKRIGSFVESPSLYPNLNAYEYLRIKQILLDIPKSEIFKYLEVVGLENSKYKKVREFSLGMKQRLSLAFAILNNPTLLILDEPTNGLDPNGIREIRNLITSLNRDFNKTIFISSHILDEVEKIATHVGILKEGTLIFEDEVNKLSRQFSKRLTIEVSNLENASNYLRKAHYKFIVSQAGLIEVEIGSQEDIIKLNKYLTELNVGITYLSSRDKKLEEVFFDLVN